MQKVSLQIGGMTCQSCASRIEKVLNKKNFVQQAGVTFASEEAQITFDEKQTSVEQLIQIIQKTGFTAQLKQEQIKSVAFWFDDAARTKHFVAVDFIVAN